MSSPGWSTPGWSTVRQNRNGFVVAFSMGKFKFSHHGQVKFLTIDVFIVIFNIQRTGCKKWMLLTFWEKKPFPQTLYIIYLCSLFELQLESSCSGFSWVYSFFYQN
jgi:hypothetical protein